MFGHAETSAHAGGIGFVGEDDVTAALAHLTARAGHAVRLGDDAVDCALVVLGGPVGAVARWATELREALRGGVVLHTTNYYRSRVEHPVPALEDGFVADTEWVQQQLPGARVVKGFNLIHPPHLCRLSRASDAPDRSAVAIAGDDYHAVGVVAAFADAIGFDVVDAGPLAESWRLQDPWVWLPLYAAHEAAFIDGRGPDDPDVPRVVTARDVRAVLDREWRRRPPAWLS